jgi:hypothetical protein
MNDGTRNEELKMETVEIGTSPAGVEWICYPRENETPETFAARVATMTANLVARRAKYAEVLARGTECAVAVRTVRLTRGESRWLDYSMQNLPDQDLLDRDEWGLLSDSYRAGATYVRGNVEDLDILATCAANILEADDHIDAVVAPSEALWDRNRAAAERCLEALVAKLRRPLRRS